MNTKLEKMAKQLNEKYRTILSEKFKEEFDIDITMGFNVTSMSLISMRDDGKNFTRKQKEFIRVFESGYVSAMNQVHE